MPKLKHIVTSKQNCHGISTNWTWLQSRRCLRGLEAEHGHFPIWKLMVHTKIHSQLVDFGGHYERVCPLIKITLAKNPALHLNPPILF